MLTTNVKKLPNSVVEIEGELHADAFESYFDKALKKISVNVELDGFRKGKVPESVLLANISEARILEEMADMALNEHYPKILESEKIDAISRPEIMITKLARKNPLAFKIQTSVLPEVKLPDYKDIAKKIIAETKDADKNIEATDEDVENTIMDIRKSRAPKKHIADVAVGDVSENPAVADQEDGITKEPELPEFNDEFVQALGPFTDVADFKTKLKENIKVEKINQAKEKTRIKIIEQIIDATDMEVPDILTDLEVEKILYRMESDISQMGLKFEDYLKHLNKTLEDLKTEFRPDAVKKAKLALILDKIAKTENIVPDEAAVEKEVNMILEHYKEADPERARAHTEQVLTNEKIFQFLETQ